MGKRTLRLDVKISRNYGDHSIEFGLGEIVEISSGSHRRSAYQNLIAQLNDQIELYETVSMTQNRLPQIEDVQHSPSNNVMRLPITHVVVENKNGKKYISGKGGQYSKHGVPIYLDTCISDLDLDNYDYGVHDMTNHDLKMLIDVVDGKPKRVISIK